MASINFRLFTLASACTLATALAPAANAQQPATADDAPETSPVTSTPAQPQQIVYNWTFKGGAGRANVTCNPEGTCLFSGHYDGHRAGKDIDICVGLKSSTGAVILFHFVGDAATGATWSKQESSTFLKQEWATYSGGDRWAGSVHFPESKAGRRAEYEARERKREELRKAEEEARKRHDEKVAREKREQLERDEQEEAAQARAQASASDNSGSSVGTVLGVIGSVAGAILSFL